MQKVTGTFYRHALRDLLAEIRRLRAELETARKFTPKPSPITLPDRADWEVSR
ncbi:MAG: hypothetical protein ABFD89_11315 [Bryobacteraceae bacterium]